MNSPGRKKLLIIEDEADISFVLESLLESEGYEVKTAANGLIALQELSKSGLPDLILLDMKMPVMNGWEFAAEFYRLYDQKTPILVMTAAGDIEKRAGEIEAKSWLGKPFTLPELLEKVKTLTHPDLKPG